MDRLILQSKVAALFTTVAFRCLVVFLAKIVIRFR